MENLKKKTFCTIFIIISLFAFFFAILFNVQSYKQEYSGILNSITRMRNLIDDKREPFNKKIEPINDEELHNRKVMDYELYTFVLDDNNNIIDKISHSDNAINDEVLRKVKSILINAKTDEIKIGSLYFSNYAYNLINGKFLTIVNIKNVKSVVLMNLLNSLILVILSEIFIYIISKKITDWLTKPVEMSFNNQKEFVANASHELKTPLAVMIASIDCLQINKKNEKWINNLKSESEKMNNLITRLLDLSKSESYITKENLSINDISIIVEKRALTFESLAFEKNVTIQTNIEEKIKLLCNKESIDELISILIDNAISHSVKDSEIIVNLSKVKSEVIIEVKNKGEEIKEDECEKIFERFYRSDASRNRDNNNYGLGLAIAKNIVEGHKGTIEVFSKNGYTTFKVIFKVSEH